MKKYGESKKTFEISPVLYTWARITSLSAGDVLTSLLDLRRPSKKRPRKSSMSDMSVSILLFKSFSVCLTESVRIDIQMHTKKQNVPRNHTRANTQVQTQSNVGDMRKEPRNSPAVNTAGEDKNRKNISNDTLICLAWWRGIMRGMHAHTLSSGYAHTHALAHAHCFVRSPVARACCTGLNCSSSHPKGQT